jgi:hypothetical protein
LAEDLTAILVPAGQLDDKRVYEVVIASGRDSAIVRVVSLPAVQLMQIEVHDPRRGLPTEDPELVSRLSAGGRALFVHVNTQAKQAMLHGFVNGKPLEGFAGAPGDEFTARLTKEAGAPLDTIRAADDSTRLGIGLAASHTVVLTRGRVLALPAGTPTALDSFHFHDRGHALEDRAERLALFAFDRARVFATAGQELAERLKSAPAGAYNPLESARDEAIVALAALGHRSPAEAELGSQRALELAAFAHALAFAGGDEVQFWDERVLPLFSLCAQDGLPKAVLDAAEAEELDDTTYGILEAMTETLPFAAPPEGESPLLAQLSPAEIVPLAPWVRADAEHAGAIFLLRPERLLSLVRKLDGKRLSSVASEFARTFYRALRPGQPAGDAYETWRVAKEEEGAKDLERFINDWAELRACLEIAAANQLDVALLFYA